MLIGIDLGTTYSAAAIIDSSGIPRIIPNAEGEDTTPSVVLVDNGDFTVGRAAKDRAARFSDQVCSLMKVHMGEKVSLLEQDGKEYPPEMLSGLVLHKLIADVCARTGEETANAEVVVTVPAYFSEHQREATKQAVEIAGAKFIGSIDEPTAAALYYSQVSDIKDATILVYDFGGGTFDATLLKIQDGQLDIIGKNGVHNAGGSDFDAAIVEFVVKAFQEKTGVDLREDKYKSEYQNVVTKAETIKKSLSSVTKDSIFVSAGDKDAEIEINRVDLEEMVAPVYRLTESAMKELLFDTGFNKDQIDIVLLVGGSSQIPYVKAELSKYFGSGKLRADIDPAKAVALGAALYSTMINTSDTDSRILSDVCSHGIGIKLSKEANGQLVNYNKTIIFKNTKIPVSVEQVFYATRAGQSVVCTFTEPEFDDEEDLDYCVELGSVEVVPPADLPEGCKIVLQITLNELQMLEGKVIIPDLDYVKEFEIKRKHNLSKAELCEMATRVADAAKEETITKKETITKEEIIINQDTVSESEEPVNNKKSGNLLNSFKTVKKQSKKRPIDTTIAQYFEGIVGMKNIQEKLSQMYKTLELQDEMEARGEKTKPLVWNFWIGGEMGSGKSLVTNIICSMLYQFGLTDEKEPEVLSIFDVKDEPGKLFEASDDKVRVYLIEHAEYLQQAQSDSAQGESKEQSVFFISQESNWEKTIKAGNRFFIFTGNWDEMDTMFNQNPKLERWMDYLSIPEYSVDELMEIAEKISQLPLSDGGREQLRKLIKREMGSDKFANAITIENILDDAFKNLGARQNDGGDLTHFIEEDFAFEESDGETLESLLAQLDAMTGLEQVKADVRKKIASIKAAEERRKEGKPVPEVNNHLLLVGNAGTGKTTVAKLIGKIYGKLGIISKPDLFVESNGGDFKAGYEGQTAANTKKIVDSALGGMLFIDEAYSICRDKDDPFGTEAVTELVKLLDMYKYRMVIVLAGYEDDIDSLLKINQGLNRRFPIQNRVHFTDYSLDELVDIFNYMINDDRRGFCMKVDPPAIPAIRDLIDYEMHNLEDYGNAGAIDNMVSALYDYKNTRELQASLNPGKDSEYEPDCIYQCDIDAYMSKYTVEKSKKVDPLDELNNLIGMQAVKDHINSNIKAMKAAMLRSKIENTQPSVGKLHLILVGNPGTGKTTAARVIAKVYGKFGLLKSPNKFVELGGTQLKGSYTGQTKDVVLKAVNDAIGGVLFLDEIYALKSDQMDSFAEEAINTLLKEIEDHKDEICVIMAGYKEQTMDFLAVNPGMKRRMNTIIEIEDYTVPELTEIFYAMAKHRKNSNGEATHEFYVAEELRPIIEEKIAVLHDSDPAFSNAGGVENYLNEVITRQGGRIVDECEASGVEVDEIQAFTITEADL